MAVQVIPPPGDGRDSYPGEDGEVVPQVEPTTFDSPRTKNKSGEAATRTTNNDFSDRFVSVTICADSGALATARCPVTLQSSLLASEAPRRKCRLHRK